MLNPQDENLMIDYIFGSLEESEEAAFSERRNRDPHFDRYYRKILNALQTILEARTDEREQIQTRLKSKNLTARTMSFIRNAPSQTTASSMSASAFAENLSANQTTRSMNLMDAMSETISEKRSVAINEEIESVAEKNKII